MSKVGIWISAARPRTLPAAVAPVVVGASLAWRDSSDFQWWAALVCLFFALLIQIATNFANDYFDFLKGADTPDRVGPRRAVAAGLISPARMKGAMIAVFSLAILLGLSLLPLGGLPLLAIGLASVLCGVAYTGGPWPLAYKGLGDVFVFIFFGLVAVCATYYVQVSSLNWDAWLGGAAIGALAVNVLLTNNYRDVDTDARTGKGTLVVRFGRGFARCEFAFNHLLALAVLGKLLWEREMGPDFLCGLVAWGGLALLAAMQLLRLIRAREAAELIRLLESCGRYLMLYSLLFMLLVITLRTG